MEALGAQLQNVSGTQDPQISHGALLIFRIQIDIQTVYGQRRLLPQSNTPSALACAGEQSHLVQHNVAIPLRL